MITARHNSIKLLAVLILTGLTWQVWVFGFTDAPTVLVLAVALLWTAIAALILNAPAEWRNKIPAAALLAIALFQIIFCWGAASHSVGIEKIQSAVLNRLHWGSAEDTHTGARNNLYDLSLSGTDALGFLGSAARCNSSDQPVFLLRTRLFDRPGSKVVVCTTRSATLYYAGARDSPSDPGILIGNVTTANYGYVARNKEFAYEVSPSQLLIRRNGAPISIEPAAQHWSRR